MTDNEIIKALELCMDEDDCCGECPYEGSPERRVKVHGKDLLDLINRQKAEIERLKKHIQEGVDLAKELPQMINLAQAEAIKDFTEKANKIFTEIYNEHIFGANDLEAEEKEAIMNFSDDVTRGFDNLVKELTGDQE